MSSDRISKDVALHYARKLIQCLVNIKDETGEFLLRLEDGRVIDTKGWNGWEWTHGIGLYGLYKFYEVTKEEEALRIALKWYDDHLPLGTTKNINTMSPFLTLAHLHHLGLTSRSTLGIEKCAKHLDEWAEYTMRQAPRTLEKGLQHATYTHVHQGHLWDDTLMMSVLPLAQIGMTLGRPEYIEEAKHQFLIHVKYLADPKTGLWFHGWNFNGRHNFSGALWGRGNCWVTIAIPDFLELLGGNPTSGLETFLQETLLAQLEMLLRLQDANTGLWHTLIDDSSSYLEASASAGFVYGILKSLRMGLIPPSRQDAFRACAAKGISGIVACINETGELDQVSFGTPVFDTKQEYKKVRLTSMPYGQSLAILTLGEWLYHI